MIITCLSDLHGYKPKIIGGDILIIAGDCTDNHSVYSWAAFFEWLKAQDYEHKIVVAGNHDKFLYDYFPRTEKDRKMLQEVQEIAEEVEDFHYLCDNGIELNGIKFWGSPWTLRFDQQNPLAAYFTKDNEISLAVRYNKIPDDTDFLITHNPPMWICDKNYYGIRCGSEGLRKKVLESNIRCHVFGHIHEAAGFETSTDINNEIAGEEHKLFVNCSLMNRDYEPYGRYYLLQYGPQMLINSYKTGEE